MGKRSASLLVCALGALVVAAPAGAHLRSGTVAVVYGASVTSAPRGVSARVALSDRALLLTVHRGHTATVLGYLGEPFLRFDRRGEWVNVGSPTAAAVGLVRGRLRTGTGWVLARSGGRSAVWHDNRIQQRPRTRVGWRVPLLVDGRRAAITGQVWHVAAPALWRWLAAAVVLAAVGIALLPRARGGWPSVTLASAAIVAALAAASGFVVGAYASPGIWIESLDELAFALAGVAVLVWGPAVARAPAAAWLGLLAVGVGLSKGAIFLDGLVLSAVPATATRALAVFAVGAGTAAAVTACLEVLRQERSTGAMSSALHLGQ